MSAPQQPATVDPEVAPDLPATDDDSDDALVDDVSDGEDGGEDGDDDGEDGAADDLLVREGDVAGDYLERLLDILDVDGDIDLDVEGDRASVAIVGGQLHDLIGPEGQVLEALQELTRLAVYRETGERSRLMLDISGFRAQRRAELVTLAEKSVATVRESGAPLALDPMTPFERKVVHDVVAAAGLTSESEGVEPRRHVVVLPA